MEICRSKRLYTEGNAQKGGYNHMELRRYKRAYNDSDNGIVQGQTAKPMDQAEQWLIQSVLN